MRYNQYINIVGNVLGDGTSIDYYELVCPASCSESSDSSIYQLGYSGDNCNSPCGPELVNTLLRHGNYDYFNQDVLWDPGISEHSLPNSLYLDSKPAFFGNLHWPPIGPDVSGYVNDIPAKLRFDNPQTCLDIGGECCTGSETCPGINLGPASDCSVCCDQACEMPPEICIHQADQVPCDGCIDLNELNAYIQLYKNNAGPQIMDVMEAIGLWVEGC